MFILKKKNHLGFPITVAIPKLKPKIQIDLFVLFRALGVESDLDICKYILGNVDDSRQEIFRNYLEASMFQARGIRTEAEAFDKILNSVNYNTHPPYGKHVPVEKSEIEKERDRLHAMEEKRKYANELLNGGIFIHCSSRQQTIFLLSYCVMRLMSVALGFEPPTDRDCGPNKRVDLTGTTLLNLIRALSQRAMKEFARILSKEVGCRYLVYKNSVLPFNRLNPVRGAEPVTTYPS